MGLDNIQLVDFRRFCYMKKKTWSEETIFIEGCFKKEGSKEIISGDNFEASKVLGLSVEEIYKLYIDWFNYTLRPHEEKRVFVSAQLGDVKNE